MNAKELYYELCSKHIESMSRDDIVVMAMQSYASQQMPSDDMSNIARRENYLITEKLIPSILSENVVNEEDYNLGWDDCFDWLKSLQQEKPNKED